MDWLLDHPLIVVGIIIAGVALLAWWLHDDCSHHLVHCEQVDRRETYYVNVPVGKVIVPQAHTRRVRYNVICDRGCGLRLQVDPDPKKEKR